ncbi:MAG TPA: DUF4167 domain-containing protein [Paracoccaceae bacterium]|nr:DUF4167 domain-containing protein [Paracoccaceae bacterium]
MKRLKGSTGLSFDRRLRPLHYVQETGRDRMRSSNKNRPRNKNARKSLGNILNRVFESAGPEGKVRGTPQQIIEKYSMLSRDASTAGDRIASENFQQHAEHYTRLLAEAQREYSFRQEQAPLSQPQPQPSFTVYEEEEREPAALTTIDSDDGLDGGLVATPEGSGQAQRPAPQPVYEPAQPAAAEAPAQALPASPQEPEQRPAEAPEAGPQPRSRTRGPRRRTRHFESKGENAQAESPAEAPETSEAAAH